MKKILIPLFGAALVTAAALIAAPQQEPESCEPCDPADCCPESQNCCAKN